MTLRFIALTLTWFAFTVSHPLLAGILVDSTQTSNEASASAIRATLYFNGDDLRVESRKEGASNPDVVLIYQGVQQLLYTLTPDKKSYTKMTKVQLEQMGTLLANAMKLLPKAQLQQLEKSTGIKGLADGGGAAHSKVTYAATGNKDKIAAHSCARLVGTSGKKKVSEICAAPYKELGVQADDFRVMRTFAELLTKMKLGALVQTEFLSLWNKPSIAGLPLEILIFDDAGKWRMKSTANKVEKKVFPGSLFTPPSDYTEKPPTLSMPGAPAAK